MYDIWLETGIKNNLQTINDSVKDLFKIFVWVCYYFVYNIELKLLHTELHFPLISRVFIYKYLKLNLGETYGKTCCKRPWNGSIKLGLPYMLVSHNRNENHRNMTRENK